MYPSSQIQRTRNAVALRRGFRRAASMYVGVGTAFAYIPPIPDLADDTEEHDKGFKANITIGQVRLNLLKLLQNFKYLSIKTVILHYRAYFAQSQAKWSE